MRNVKHFVTVILLLTFVLMSCARDRNYDDEAKIKLNEDLAKISQVSGLYTGQLFSKKTGLALGDIAIEIEDDMLVSNSIDRAVPVLKGKLLFLGSSKIRLVFKDSYFDYESRSFKSNLNIVNSSGLIKVLSLEASLNENILSGQLEVSGYPENAGVFNLKMQNSGHAEDLFKTASVGNSTEFLDITNKTFIGIPTYKDGRNSKLPLRVQVTNLNSTRESNFLELFTPIKLVRVVIGIDKDVEYSLPEAEWDEESQSLTARGSYASPFYFELLLRCLPLSFEGQKAISCRLDSSRVGHVWDLIALDQDPK